MYGRARERRRSEGEEALLAAWAWVGEGGVMMIIMLQQLFWGLRPHSSPSSSPSPTPPRARSKRGKHGTHPRATPRARTGAGQTCPAHTLILRAPLLRPVVLPPHTGAPGRCSGVPEMCWHDVSTARNRRSCLAANAAGMAHIRAPRPEGVQTRARPAQPTR